MANTITHQIQTRALTNAQTWTTVADKAYVPTLTNTWTNGATQTFAEGEYGGGTTTHTQYMPVLTDDLVTKYA
jgi:hypothetical protein